MVSNIKKKGEYREDLWTDRGQWGMGGNQEIQKIVLNLIFN